MSDTTTPATGAPSATPSAPATGTDADYAGIIEQLNGEGFAPTTDQDDPDQQDAPTDAEPKIKLKVNGKTIEKTQNEIIRMAQLYSATEMKLETAKKEIEEARATKKQLEGQQAGVRELLQLMQRGDIGTIADFVRDKLNAGQVFDEACMKYAISVWELRKMPPEQREAMENKKLVAKLRSEAEEKQKHDRDLAFQYEANQWLQHIDTEIPKAIKAVGLPDTPFVQKHILSTWRAAIENGKAPTAAAVANYVKKQLQESKMLNSVQQASAPAQGLPQRPRATPESIGKRANGSDTPYQDWESWKRSRGR